MSVLDTAPGSECLRFARSSRYAPATTEKVPCRCFSNSAGCACDENRLHKKLPISLSFWIILSIISLVYARRMNPPGRTISAGIPFLRREAS